MRNSMKAFFILFALGLLSIVAIFFGEVLFENTYNFPPEIKYGVTFSPKYAHQLGLDWKQAYLQVLDELEVKYIRIPSYWNENISDTDFMVEEAEKRDVKLILVLGVKQPRWPECHIPDWARGLSTKERQMETLGFITEVVGRFEDNPSIQYWQVENEPLLGLYGVGSFGVGCNPIDRDFLVTEVELVKKISNKEVIISDSGEFGFWVIPMQLSDVFGTTLYRTVYSNLIGYTSYPYLPYMYNLKASLIEAFFETKAKKTIIVELQAEPWSKLNNLKETPIEEQMELFSVNKFKSHIMYAKKTGFSEAYLWGVEWWYWMKEMGHPEYWEYAKDLFN